MKHSACFHLLINFLIIFGFSNSASAYIDPGTGSMFLQLLLGGIAGVLVVLKLYWRQFTSFFRRDSQRDSERSPSDD
jgi:opacity protein-like surface antigen